MKSYSGGATFSSDIERYYEKSSGTFVTLDDPRVPEDDNDFEYEYRAITLTIVGTATYSPAKLYGLPEDCHPDESECDFESITDEEGNDWSNSLTPKEYEELVQQLFQETEATTHDNEVDYDDDNSYID